jgi:predicted Rossmann fold nucleotide-binding protein DprA/Smf involved in DNA uptake
MAITPQPTLTHLTRIEKRVLACLRDIEDRVSVSQLAYYGQLDATSVNDALCELESLDLAEPCAWTLGPEVPLAVIQRTTELEQLDQLGDLERRIFQLLRKIGGGATVDELAYHTKLPSTDIIDTLSELEDRGLVTPWAWRAQRVSP